MSNALLPLSSFYLVPVADDYFEVHRFEYSSGKMFPTGLGLQREKGSWKIVPSPAFSCDDCYSLVIGENRHTLRGALFAIKQAYENCKTSVHF